MEGWWRVGGGLVEGLNQTLHLFIVPNWFFLCFYLLLILFFIFYIEDIENRNKDMVSMVSMASYLHIPIG